MQLQSAFVQCQTLFAGSSSLSETRLFCHRLHTPTLGISRPISSAIRFHGQDIFFRGLRVSDSRITQNRLHAIIARFFRMFKHPATSVFSEKENKLIPCFITSSTKPLRFSAFQRFANRHDYREHMADIGRGNYRYRRTGSIWPMKSSSSFW